ncbi:unnamed protein product [Mucor hiemalis]
MPITKPNRTSASGLRQAKPYNRFPVNEGSLNAPETGFFPLKPTRYPPGTPLTAVRSRKVYSDLVDERAFLEDIKEFWGSHKYLTKMSSVQKNQVVGVEPLFAKEVQEPLELQYPSLPSAVLADESDSNTDTQLSSPKQTEVNTTTNNLDQLKQLEVLFKNQFSDDDDENGGSEEDEEDEAKTREALSLLLQEFGDM